MRGRVPGTGFPHVLGVCREYHICTSVTGTVSGLLSHPGSGAPAGRAWGVGSSWGPGRLSGESGSSRCLVAEEGLFRVSRPSWGYCAHGD